MRLLDLCTFGLFAGLAAYAACSTMVDFGQAGIRATAEDLDMRRKLTAIEVHEAARSPAIDAALASCRGPLLDQAKTVVLYDLNQVNQVSDYEAWARSHARGQAFLRGLVRCSPMDGDGWIRDAMVSRAIAEDAGELKTKLEVSGQLSPFERQQVLARLALWKRLSAHALGVNASQVQTDIMTVLRYGSDPAVKTLAFDAPDAFRRLIEDQIAILSADRRMIIRPLLDLSQTAPRT